MVLTSRLVPDRLRVGRLVLEAILAMILPETSVLIALSGHLQFALRFRHVLMHLKLVIGPSWVNLRAIALGTRRHRVCLLTGAVLIT